MTQENKELLLKDLCARLPYGVKVQVEYDAEEFGKTVEIDEITMIDKYGEEILLYHASEYFSIEELKPYLRPMSSMTEEEKEEFESLGWRVDELDDNAPWNHNSYNVFDGVDWLNKKMFAYRTIDGKDMFELGLAFKAPEGMYKTWNSLRGNLKEDNQGNIVGGLKL